MTLGAALLLYVDAYGQELPFNNLGTTQVTCGNTATLAASARYRNAVTIKVPTSGATVYIGGPNVTTSTGFGIDGGTAMTLQPYAGAVYCVTSSSQAVGVAETF